MAAGNDFRHLDEWIGGNLKVPKEELAKLVAAGGWFLQLRLCAAILHESLNVLRDMEKQGHLTTLETKLDREGVQSLVSLRRVMDGTSSVKRLLERVRHKGTFHFDQGQFRKSLAQLLRQAGDQEESLLIWERPGLFGGGTYYQFADSLRTEATLGIAGEAEAGKTKMEQITDVIEVFRTFLRAAFVAYVKVRRLENEFRRRPPAISTRP